MGTTLRTAEGRTRGTTLSIAAPAYRASRGRRLLIRQAEGQAAVRTCKEEASAHPRTDPGLCRGRYPLSTNTLTGAVADGVNTELSGP
jgi:hypothetical protein